MNKDHNAATSVQRNTVQRDMVLNAAKSLPHPTADEIYAYIHHISPSVSKGTVYRNLNLLAGRGELRRFRVPGGADVYDKTTCDHYHLKCSACGRIVDIGKEYINDLPALIKAESGFVVDSYEILMYGICPECTGKTVNG